MTTKIIEFEKEKYIAGIVEILRGMKTEFVESLFDAALSKK